MKKYKDCKGCKHYRTSFFNWVASLIFGEKFSECHRKTNLNSCFTNGQYSFCALEREEPCPVNKNYCGPEGKYFEPKKSAKDQYELNYEKETPYL